MARILTTTQDVIDSDGSLPSVLGLELEKLYHYAAVQENGTTKWDDTPWVKRNTSFGLEKRPEPKCYRDKSLVQILFVSRLKGWDQKQFSLEIIYYTVAVL